MDELRFRSQQSPHRNDTSLLGLVSPPRNGSRLPQAINAQDNRNSGLTRRFTTESGRVPTIGSIGTQRAGQESQEYGPSVCGALPLFAIVLLQLCSCIQGDRKPLRKKFR